MDCPPIETVIAFWTGEGTRYRFKIFKPVADVVEDDLPVFWLLPSLIDYGDLGCDCC
jgi:nitrate reductase delta subunit